MPPPHPHEKVFTIRKTKSHRKFLHLFKAILILMANRPFPGQQAGSWPCPVPLRLTTSRSVAFCSWPTEPTLRKHSCNNIQIRRSVWANAKNIK